MANGTGVGVAIGGVAVELLLVVDGDLGDEAVGCDQRREEGEESEASNGSHHCDRRCKVVSKKVEGLKIVASRVEGR